MKSQLYGPRWRGGVLGIASAFAGLSASSLIAGVSGGALSPVNAVGEEFIRFVPSWLKDLAIAWFGTRDKLALQVGIGLVLLLISVAIGLWAQRRKMGLAYGVTVAIGVIGALAVIARPNAGLGSLIATAVGTLVSCAVLAWLAPRIQTVSATEQPESATEQPESATGPAAVSDRRSFLHGVGVVGVASIAGGGVGTLLSKRGSVEGERSGVTLPGINTQSTAPSTTADVSQYRIPASALSQADQAVADIATTPQPVSVLGAVAGDTDFGIEGVTPFVVPSDRFYKIDTSLATPQVSVDDWRLRIHGMVERELELSYQDLQNRPQIERAITLSCVSNKVGGGLVGNAKWQGVRLADLLNEAGIKPGASQVASRSIDGWSCGSPTAVIMDGRDAMVALGMNGEPLPADHGYPARLVVPGLFGYVSATKWVTDIELLRWEDFDGYWMTRGWAKLGPIKTMARIDRPAAARPLAANDDGSVDIAGVAWAVHRGVSAVEVSIDGGDWVGCELAGVPSDDTWRLWRYRLDAAPSGNHTVAARAYDGNGVVQPVGPKDVAPDGAEGYHTVTFIVQ